MFNKTFRELYIERQKTNPASLTTVKLAFGFSSSDGGNARSIGKCSYPASGNSAATRKELVPKARGRKAFWIGLACSRPNKGCQWSSATYPKLKLTCVTNQRLTRMKGVK